MKGMGNVFFLVNSDLIKPGLITIIFILSFFKSKYKLSDKLVDPALVKP